MAEFLTVNLGSILKNQRSFADLDSPESHVEQAPVQERDPSQISDWAKELKDRLAENKALGADKRKSEPEVEAKFFEDYFNYGETWNGSYTDELLGLGEPLKKAIKVLGFDKNINPILGFITDDVVLRNLLQTKLLNASTFKAIYNAVAKKLVADSEFFASNDYNIIYCQDLYRKPLADIVKYLTLQKGILSPSASTYTKADQDRNKKTFFNLVGIRALEVISKRYPEESSERYEKEPATKLNDLVLASVLAGKTSNKADDDEASNEQYSSVGDVVIKIINGKGNNNARALAAIQYLSATTDIPEAKAVLKHEAFKTVSMEDFIAASAIVTKIMKEAKLPTNEVKSFIALILNKLERTV